MSEEFLWVEKYRPKTISECILPDTIKNPFLDFVSNKEIPNLLLCGTAGVGKTTVARALCNDFQADYILINGSEERNIDTLRVKIKNFASTVSLSGGPKIVILDEADYLNPQSTQPALRGFIEEFSKNCRFIFTCNYKNRIIPPLHSRCSVVDFTIQNDQKPMIANMIFQRILMILNQEDIKVANDKVVAELINKFFPDFRRVLNELQIGHLKNKEFSKMRKWVAMNIHNDPQAIYRKLYDSFFNLLENRSVPQSIIILSDYSYKSAFVADQEVNMVACLTELMMEAEFK